MDRIDWPGELAEIGAGDETLPPDLHGINVVLNRARLATFLRDFAGDSEVRDFLLLDLASVATDAEISSTGEVEDWPALALRPFRLWEYVWLYKALGLHQGGHRVLDLGGPASHIVIAAALAGNAASSIDINPRIVEAGNQCARLLHLPNHTAETGDMRDLSRYPAASFDRIVCCSVLEHLTGEDQRIALGEMARVLAPGGVIGLTFDYGPPAPGANIYLPPPHEPPANPDEVRYRYAHSGLAILGNSGIEPPIPRSLFRDTSVSYTMSALFLGKDQSAAPAVPAPAVRETSLLARLHISELPYRLNRKIFSQATASQEMSAKLIAFQDVAENRLAELDRITAEARLRSESIHALTAEIHERDRQLEDLRAAASERLRLIEQLETERQSLQQAADERLRVADDRLRAITEIDATLRQAISDNGDLHQNIIDLKNEKLLTYVRRRFGAGNAS